MLAIPPDLEPRAKEVAEAIAAFLEERKSTYTGGCRPFYSPQEWKERGESYGTKAILVVVHDGGDHAPYFSLDACYRTGAASDYEPHTAMTTVLDKRGVYAEQCTSWYTAIYPL